MQVRNVGGFGGEIIGNVITVNARVARDPVDSDWDTGVTEKMSGEQQDGLVGASKTMTFEECILSEFAVSEDEEFTVVAVVKVAMGDSSSNGTELSCVVGTCHVPG